MYREPYNGFANAKVMKDVENLNEQIKSEKVKPNRNNHRINRLNEQKMIQGLFNNELGSAYGRYRSPW